MPRILFALLALTLLGSTRSAVSAQPLETGTWTGYIYPPNGDQLPVTYDVRMESDTLKIDISNERMGLVPVQHIEFSENGMRFVWSPGVDLSCQLKLKANGGYEGDCAPEGGQSGAIVMNPPAKEE